MKKILILITVVVIGVFTGTACSIADAVAESQKLSVELENTESAMPSVTGFDGLDYDFSEPVDLNPEATNVAPKYSEEELSKFEGHIFEDVYSEEDSTKNMRQSMDLVNQEVFSDIYSKVNENNLDLYFVLKNNVDFKKSDMNGQIDICKDLFEDTLAQMLMIIPVELTMYIHDEKGNELHKESTVLDTEKIKATINDPNAKSFDLDDELLKTAQEYVDILNKSDLFKKQQETLDEGVYAKYILEGQNIVLEFAFDERTVVDPSGFEMTKKEEETMFAPWIAEVKMILKDPEKHTIEYRYRNLDTNEIIYSVKSNVK